jgi:hypothetical protein
MVAVHIDPRTRSGNIFKYPNVNVFSTSWFQWLENEAPPKMAFFLSDERDDEMLCSVQKIEGMWYVKYQGFSRNYLVSIGPSSELTFDNFWSALRLVQQFAHREEGSLRRQG